MNLMELENKVVKKHNDLIRTKIHGFDTPLSQKVLACLIAQINNNDNDLSNNYEFDARFLFLPSRNGRNYTKLRELVTSLIMSKVEINTTMYSIFMMIQYGDGILRARFNSFLQPYLINLKKHFTQINLLEYLTLSSNYSQRLFEILKSWSGLPQIEIPINELHKLLNTAESQRKNFKEFRIYVIEKSYKEIIEKTNFYFKYEIIKKGIGKTSPVIAIKFIFFNENKKEKFPLVEFFEKPEKENAVMLADKCRKIYGNNCTGGNQKEIVCTLCNLMNKKNINK